MSSHLIEQIMHEQKFGKEYAQRVAMLMNLAEAGRPLIDAARAAGISPELAGKLAVNLNITFKSGGPA